ncbi:Asr1405/Asl0597 family protein [Egbenema bharatensis]|uniref:Asr1405/Asl0597 family protein n=1 Tax=Egbenema bharatensis TaxID=3463334 RepID=UPI003A847538
MDYPSFSSVPSSTPVAQIVAIDRCDRWQVHHRLQELDISCTCLSDGRLQVEVDYPIAAIQLWSVARHITASRSQLANWLERCWALS